MSASGSLFDLDKLINISKNYISKQSKDEVYENTCLWAKVYDKEFYNILKKYPDYTKSILNIERETKNQEKIMVDIVMYLKTYFICMMSTLIT